MGKIPTFGIGSVGVRIGETEGIGGGEASAAVELSLEDLYIFRKLSSALAAGDRQILHTPDVLRLFQKNARTERLIFVETLSFVDKSVPHLRLHDYVNHLYPPVPQHQWFIQYVKKLGEVSGRRERGRFAIRRNSILEKKAASPIICYIRNTSCREFTNSSKEGKEW